MSPLWSNAVMPSVGVGYTRITNMVLVFVPVAEMLCLLGLLPLLVPISVTDQVPAASLTKNRNLFVSAD